MQRRMLGEGLEVTALGLGCMGMSWSYGSIPERGSRCVSGRRDRVAGCCA
ncbi:MAG: hypothetical protein KGN36_01245 [Acidobacteriota bacterium]|nr:hypothetical protein [Acidobacteriota bacterium]